MNDTVYDLSEISKFQKKISFYMCIIFTVLHVVIALINGTLKELNLGILMSLLALIGVFIIYLILGLIISGLLFQPSITAYKKNLKDKEEIFNENKKYWWTIIIPTILYSKVIIEKKHNSILDEDYYTFK